MQRNKQTSIYFGYKQIHRSAEAMYLRTKISAHLNVKTVLHGQAKIIKDMKKKMEFYHFLQKRLLREGTSRKRSQNLGCEVIEGGVSHGAKNFPL